jgi:isocitrate/isopropylmalate dehydrogenase
MMLDHLGETGAADRIETAIATALGAGEIRTRDMGGSHSTAEMGTAVAAAMRASA